MTSPLQRRVWACFALGAVLAAAGGWLWQGTGPLQSIRSTSTAAPVGAEQPGPGQRDSPDSRPLVASSHNLPAREPFDGPLPGSLRDSDVDGELAVGPDGRLILSPAVRRFFDYFFVASGEESEAQIRRRIEAEILARTGGDAQHQTLDLLDRYIAYRARARALAAEAPAHADLVTRAEALRQLRRDSFGDPAAAALFADEDAAVRFALEQRRISADPQLSEAEREAQIAALEAQLPPPMRVARDAATAPLRLARDERALRDAGGTTEEVQALREEAVGLDAAQRLAVLDQQRAEWQDRIDAYRRARAQLDAAEGLDSDARTAALEHLRAQHFHDSELARVRALDRIAAEPPAAE